MGRSGERRRTMERWVGPVANKITTGKDSSKFFDSYYEKLHVYSWPFLDWK